MSGGLQPLTGLSLERAPTVCHDCVFWQSHGSKEESKAGWSRDIEHDWGSRACSTTTLVGVCSVSCSSGPRGAFRARRGFRPALHQRALLITCGYVVDESAPWVL